MNIEDIQSLWSADAPIDRSQLDLESLRIPELHNKYYKILIAESVKYRQLENEYKILYKLKCDYYLGKFSDEEYQETGWKVQNKIIIKTELPIHIEGDTHICDFLVRLTLQKEKVEFLKSIIYTLNGRNFVIKNAIDFLKFSNGIS